MGRDVGVHVMGVVELVNGISVLLDEGVDVLQELFQIVGQTF